MASQDWTLNKLICPNANEDVEPIIWYFWRLLNHFSVVLACFHAQSEDGLAMFRMMSTLKVLVGKDLSLQDHKKAQFQRLAFALQSLLNS